MSRGTWEPDPGSPTHLPYRTVTLCGAPFQTLRLRVRFVTPRPDRNRNRSGPATPAPQRLRAITWRRFGLFPVRSPLLGESRLLSLPTGTEMFQFPALASCPYGFRAGSPRISREGLPHSGIPGLASVCDYPGLIAAYHALHRLLVPRHPPYTLSSLTPLCFGETEWIPDRYSVVKERIPPWAEYRFRALHPRETRGGDERNRTADPLLAKQVLSRLSYIPTTQFRNADCGIRNPHSAFYIPQWVVGLPGIEPGTSRLSSVRSSQLS